MAIYVNTAEGGSNGTTVTIANSGGASGNAFDQVTAGITYSSSAATRGSLGFATSTASTQYVRWSITDTQVLLRSYIRIADPLVGGTVQRVAVAEGAITVYSVTTAGRIRVSFGSNLAISPSAIQADTVYRVELFVKEGTGNGEIRVAVYEGDSTTAWWDSGVLGGLTMSTISTLMFGKYDTSASHVEWDDVGAKTGSDAVWGAWPAVSGAPNATSPKYISVLPGTTFTLSGAGSTGGSGNTITGWQWTALWPSSGAPVLSGATSQTASGTSGTLGDVYVYRLSVTNSAAMTDTSTTNVLVVNSDSGANQELVWNGTSWV